MMAKDLRSINNILMKKNKYNCRPIVQFLFLVTNFFVFSTFQISAQAIVKEGAIIIDPDQKYFSIIRQHPDLVIDHKNHSQFEVYGPNGTLRWLKDLGAKMLPLPENSDEKDWTSSGYPTPEEIEQQLKLIVSQNKDIMKLTSIGQTPQSRELWVVKISDNPEIDELEPEVKYIANMHGNEIVGREVMLDLLEDIGKKYRNGDNNIVSLVNETEIFIMPSMNPDGAANKRRGNDNWRDLNRNFPDFTTSDNVNNSLSREPETVAVMTWQQERNFALSANFHGGTKVVNYPWDTSREEAPLTDLVIALSREYAQKVPGFYDSTEFEDGIVNGNIWYEVNGGMQDWSYYYHNDLQVTIELSHSKWPNYDTMDSYYQDNKESLIQFLSRVHQGQGFKFSQKKKAISISINQKLDSSLYFLGSFSVYHNEFYKVLPIGNYNFTITYENEESESLDIQVDFPKRGYKANYLLL